MIGLFDSGHGGLTVLRALAERFPQQQMIYLGDHANAPYGDRDAQDVIALTQTGVSRLFDLGCRLVLLACNTATAVACRKLQCDWLPTSGYGGHNLLGIVAPTVEVATQVPWAVTTPQYPQKYNTETIAVFGTSRTIASNVYDEEIRKRCPQVRVIQQACPTLASGIETGWSREALAERVSFYVAEMLEQAGDQLPERVILGCTHYPLVEDLFRDALPDHIRILGQPSAVADSLEDYLSRHAHYATPGGGQSHVQLLTTGDAAQTSETLSLFWADAPRFQNFGKFTGKSDSYHRMPGSDVDR
ncbi:MAG: glutamate racemase [Hyphomicrobiaceae bacterium]